MDIFCDTICTRTKDTIVNSDSFAWSSSSSVVFEIFPKDESNVYKTLYDIRVTEVFFQKLTTFAAALQCSCRGFRSMPLSKGDFNSYLVVKAVMLISVSLHKGTCFL